MFKRKYILCAENPTIVLPAYLIRNGHCAYFGACVTRVSTHIILLDQQAVSVSAGHVTNQSHDVLITLYLYGNV